MIVVLAGPPAVGHNTIAELLARTRERSAIIDNDLVREMIIKPQAAPGEGPEWDRQYDLSIRNVCALARNFDRDGIDVFVADVVEPEVIHVFREELSTVANAKIILLTADADILIRRDISRDVDHPGNTPEVIAWHGRIRHLRDTLSAQADLYDHVVDNSHLDPHETAMAVQRLLGRAKDSAQLSDEV